jgi:thymidine kinase
LVLLGETEEYEPLSRAAYYRAMRKNQEDQALDKVKKTKNQ